MSQTLRVIGATLLAIASVCTGPAHACQQPPQNVMPGVHEWLRKARTNSHPLAGRIFANEALRGPMRLDDCFDIDPLFAVVTDVAKAASQQSGIALVGEVHDNPRHHELQAEVLRRTRSLRTDGTRPDRPAPAAVFEHIRTDQQPALDLFSELSRKGQHLDRPAEFFRFLKWDQSGWPDKALFQPLFRAAIEGRHPILPGDPPREQIRAVAKQGLSLLPTEQVQRLGLDQPLDAKLHDALLTELEASHCGLVPKAAFTTMADAQRYRDAHLADAVAQAHARHGSAILFAGNGHIRADRGVPLYLRQLAPGRALVTVLLIEVEPGKIDAASIIPRDPEGRAAADFIIFTPRVERKDPCLEMRERFSKRPPQ
ncbi:MAG: ChaN family lipoprotein [Hyphomicrobiaceae bacterium]